MLIVFPLHITEHLLLLRGRLLLLGPMRGTKAECLLFLGLVLKRPLLRLPLVLLRIHGVHTTQKLGLLIPRQEENVRGSRESKRQIQLGAKSFIIPCNL